MRPFKILLLRHAEEPEDPRDPDLSARGRLRAEHLAGYLPDKSGQPDFLVAAAPNKLSARAFLTMRPLSIALEIPVVTCFKAVRGPRLAYEMFSDSRYSGKLIVICWTHTELPKLANLLGARRRDCPDPWPETVFDLTLQFSFRRPGKPVVTTVRQPF